MPDEQNEPTAELFDDIRARVKADQERTAIADLDDRFDRQEGSGIKSNWDHLQRKQREREK